MGKGGKDVGAVTPAAKNAVTAPGGKAPAAPGGKAPNKGSAIAPVEVAAQKNRKVHTSL